MHKYEINIRTYMYLGILDEEKECKNSVNIRIDYISSSRPDYSSVYRSVMDIVSCERFGYMEDCAKHIHQELASRFDVEGLTVSLEKLNPLQMKHCRGVKVTYGQ